MSHQFLAKSASIISRGSNRFFDQVLLTYEIGCGQQFFLRQIAEYRGINMYDLAKLGHFDKATATRAVQKLLELEYIFYEIDENDRRVHHLYTTEKAEQLLKYLDDKIREWEQLLTSGLTADEIELAGVLMNKIAQNASKYQKEGRNKND